MIEDKELRDLFKVEAGEHLQRLSDGLLRLEKEPKSQPIIEEIFREAHSLKGAARMVGVSDIEMLGHSLEDLIGAAKNGKSVLTAETIDHIYKVIDSMNRLVNEAVTGEPSGVNVEEEINKIAECRVQSQELKAESRIQEPVVKIGKPPPPPSEFKIETVRVDTKMLDILMTQAGELTVIKGHIARQINYIDEIIELWEEIERKKIEFGVQSLEIKSKIQNLKSKTSEDSSRLNFVSDRLDESIRKVRLIPLSAILNLYPRMVRDMAREKSKEAELIIEGGSSVADKRIVEEMKDPLMHIIRNSIDHGIEKPDEREKKGKPRKGTVTIKCIQTASNIVIEVSDDGKGLDIEAIKQTILKRNIYTEEELSKMTKAQIESLIFISGFSTSSFVSDVSGRGVGLDVVRTNVEHLKGTVALESYPDKGCKFRIKLPVTLSTMRVMITTIGGSIFAIPVEYVEMSRMIAHDDIFTIAGRKAITIDENPVSVARLSELLEIGSHSSDFSLRPSASPCIFLSVNSERFGIIVDELIDEQEVVLKPQSSILRRVRNISGATILATGEVCMVLSPQDILKSIRRLETPFIVEKPIEEIKKKKSILLVEDSITTRTQEKRILDGAGYEVVAAVDGVDAINKLNSRSFDAVVSDIVMPNMDGLTLTVKIRGDKRFKELPVILVTTLSSDEDKRKGMEVGANAYLPKPAFDQKAFLEILERLI